MGMDHCHKAIVPATVDIAGDGYGEIKNWHLLITDRQSFIEENEGEEPVDFEIKSSGWKVCLNGSGIEWVSRSFGKTDGINAYVVLKGDKEVFMVNSSEYAGVGEYRITVFANDSDTLVEFLNDVGEADVISNIEAPGIAEQWL